jgi:hypothetical protein
MDTIGALAVFKNREEGSNEKRGLRIWHDRTAHNRKRTILI